MLSMRPPRRAAPASSCADATASSSSSSIVSSLSPYPGQALRRAHAAARQLFGSLYSLGPGFADPDLEEEFLADFFTRMRLIMWLGALSGLLFTAMRFVSVYLHIHHPGVHEKCCSSLERVINLERADHELAVRAAEMLSPLVGVMGMASLRPSLWLTERLMVCGIIVDKRDSGQSHAMVAAAFRLCEVVMVLCLMWTGTAGIAVAPLDHEVMSIRQTIWIMSTYGSIMQLRFVAHLVWSAVVLLAHFAAFAHVIRARGWCTDLAMKMLVLVMVSISSVFLARFREQYWRRHFVAMKQATLLADSYKQLLLEMVPDDVAQHLLSAVGPNRKEEWGQSHSSVSVLFISVQPRRLHRGINGGGCGEETCQVSDAGVAGEFTPGAHEAEVANVCALHQVFCVLDQCVAAMGDTCYKVETIGNTYVVASGVGTRLAVPNHAQELAALACDIAHAMRDVARCDEGGDEEIGACAGLRWSMGLHCGAVFAGVAGTSCPRFRLFGDTMNTSSRMCSAAQDKRIQVSGAFADALGANFLDSDPTGFEWHGSWCTESMGDRWGAGVEGPTASECRQAGALSLDILGRRVELEDLGTVEIKGKGPMRVCHLRPCSVVRSGTSAELPELQSPNIQSKLPHDAVCLELSAHSSATPAEDHTRAHLVQDKISVKVEHRDLEESATQSASVTINVRDTGSVRSRDAFMMAYASSELWQSNRPVTLSEEETAMALELLTGPKEGTRWFRQCFRNKRLELLYSRRRSNEGLPRQVAGGIVVVVVWGGILLRDISVLLRHAILHKAAVIALVCWVAMLLSGTVLFLMWYQARRGALAWSLNASACRLQAACAIVVALGFCVFSHMGLLGCLFSPEGKVLTWSADGRRAVLTDFRQSWLPSSGGFASMSLYHQLETHMLFCLSMQVWFNLSFLEGIGCALFCLVMAPFDVAIRSPCEEGDTRSFTISIGVLIFFSLYNIWLQEKLTRREMLSMLTSEATYLRIQEVNLSLMPPHVLKCMDPRSVVSKIAGVCRNANFSTSLERRSAVGSADCASTSTSEATDPLIAVAGLLSDNCYLEHRPRVALLMADVQGFTAAAARMDPKVLFSCINSLFTKFDELCHAYGVRKIETIGDAYLCVAGVENPADGNDAARLAAMGLRMQEIMLDDMGSASQLGLSFRMRIGLHVGSCIGGIVGERNLRYHLFGNTVDVVMAVESCGTTNGVVCTRSCVLDSAF